MNDDPLVQLLKPADVCRRLCVSRSWLYAAAQDGRIPSIRVGGPGGPLRFVPADLERHLEEARGLWRAGESTSAALRSVKINQTNGDRS